jgi:ABC-2 type transport system ATP-binding protein
LAAELAVRARGVVKRYADVIALDHIDLDVPTGEVHGLVGPNGAGKTTLLAMLLGLSAPDGGTLEINGRPVARGGALPSGVAGFLDGPSLYPALTAAQNLATLAGLRGIRDRSRVTDALDRVGLTEVAADRVAGFSLGMRQRLGLAAALLTRPRLMVLDEPANGLDPAGRRQVHTVISELAAAGTAVVLSSHQMDELAALCGEVTLLATGRVVFTGPVAKLAAESGDLDYRVRTTDPDEARRLASGVPGVGVVVLSTETAHPDAVRFRATPDGLDALVARLVEAGIGVRELAPVVSPLEAAFLALTESDDQQERSAR